MMKKNAGFTLMELMVAIAIVGIITAIAIPNILVMLPRWRAKTAATDLMGNLQLAKLTAIRKGVFCDVIFSTGPDQYEISYTDTKEGVPTTTVIKTVTLSDYGSGVEFRGPPTPYLDFEPTAGAITITFNNRGMITAPLLGGLLTGGYAYFSAANDHPELRAAADPNFERRYFRVGVNVAGVVEFFTSTANTATNTWGWE